MDKNKNRQIPETKELRENLRSLLRVFVSKNPLTPPLLLEDLSANVAKFISENKIDEKYSDWLVVILNNELWRFEFLKIPHARRVLLLPQCLRNSKKCEAGFDEFGLLCKSCGACNITDLQAFADDFGAPSLVSDSTGAVEALIEEGTVSAVLGVSCMNSLEKSFPVALKKGIVGIAIPLLKDGCVDTAVDVDWVKEIFSGWKKGFTLPSDAEIQRSANEIFTKKNLMEFLGEAKNPTSRIAVEYMQNAGKRWRPRLALAAYCALVKEENYSPLAKRIALAAECFHKASLIHDDIEDNDEYRDGAEALHKKVGVAQALNVGDFLQGAGYTILSECGEFSADLVKAAGRAHKILCEGQGAELELAHKGETAPLPLCLEIYKNKTGAAFGASLEFAAICAGKFLDFSDVINSFSENLGVAYQLLDEWRDSEKQGACSVFKALEKTLPADKVRAEFVNLYGKYRQAAYKSLTPLQDRDFKRLLFSMAGRILSDVD